MTTDLGDRTPATPSVRLRSTTSRPHRVGAMAVYAVLLGVWTWILGMPNDTIQVFLWLWLATVAWDIDAEPRQHLQFLRDWWPPLLGLVVYFYSRGIADNLGRDVAVRMPIDVDRWLFDGRLPTEVLQSAWCGSPCNPSSDPRWYDLVFTTVYASHFVTGLTIAAVLWVRNRDEWARWMRRLVAISFTALVIYVAYPMAPPWYASRDGFVDSDLPRITGRGWEDIGIDRLNLLLGGVGNKVAAYALPARGHRPDGRGVRHLAPTLAGALAAACLPGPHGHRPGLLRRALRHRHPGGLGGGPGRAGRVLLVGAQTSRF